MFLTEVQQNNRNHNTTFISACFSIFNFKCKHCFSVLFRRSGYHRSFSIINVFFLFILRWVLPEKRGPTIKFLFLTISFSTVVTSFSKWIFSVKYFFQDCHWSFLFKQKSHLFYTFCQNSCLRFLFYELHIIKINLIQKSVLITIVGKDSRLTSKFTSYIGLSLRK